MRNRFETFAAGIIDLNRCLQKIKDAEMKRFGLRASHAMCLYYLGRNSKGLTVTQLTALCREDKAAVSRSLSQLVEKGFVCCTLTENKRSYRTPYFLTAQGQKLAALMNERIETALSHCGSGLTEEQRNTFYDALELIRANLMAYVSCEA